MAQRLIDLTAFEKKYAVQIEDQGKEKSYYSLSFLENEPSVDAIPVEWIHQQIREQDKLEDLEWCETGERIGWSTAWKILIERWHDDKAD